MAKGWTAKVGKGRGGKTKGTGGPATAEERADIYQRVADRIVAAIEAGTAAGDWRMPWHSSADGQPSAVPCNAATGKPYRGVNILVLWAAVQAGGYGSSTWATYRQWRELGVQVRKGEQASPVMFWRLLDERGADKAGDGGDEDEAGGHRRLLARSYSVFNAAQVDGYQAPALPVLPEVERITHADAFFVALGADIRHGGSRACYVPSLDQIRMPPYAAFRDPVAYYATLAHEATHYTAHPSRCARGDKRAIFAAAAKAQAAADWMHARQGAAEPEAKGQVAA